MGGSENVAYLKMGGKHVNNSDIYPYDKNFKSIFWP